MAKKKITKKKTDKDIIKEQKLKISQLEKCNDDLASSMEKAAVIIVEWKRDVANALKNESAYADKKELISEIVGLKATVRSEGASLPMTQRILKEENTKLWYMIRVAMGDKNLEEPIEIDTNRSMFPLPGFDC